MMEVFNMTQIQIAEWLHDSYESISENKGWDTQKNCKVPFKELPDSNKMVMLEMANLIIANINDKFAKRLEEEIRSAYVHGIGNAEMMEAGLERNETEDYVNSRMQTLNMKQ